MRKCIFVCMKAHPEMTTVRHFIETIRLERDFKGYAAYFKQNPDALHELIALTGSNEAHPVPEYASWILTHLPDEGVDISGHKVLLTQIFLSTENESVLRNVTRVLQKVAYDEALETAVFDRCMSILCSSVHKVAAQAFALNLLIRFVRKYPGLRPEVLQTAELHSRGKTAAYQTALGRFKKQTA